MQHIYKSKLFTVALTLSLALFSVDIAVAGGGGGSTEEADDHVIYLRKGFKPEKEPEIPQSAFVFPERKLRLDERRQMAFYGTSLDELPPLTEPFVPTQEDSLGVYFQISGNVPFEEPVKPSTTAVPPIAEPETYAPPAADKDGRTEVPQPAAYPWRMHGHLEMTFGHNAIYLGSATLIAGQYAITAGHNLYDRATGRVVQKAVFYPGRKDNVAPWRVEATNIAVHPGYYTPGSADVMGSDIGIVKFGVPIGMQLGYMGLSALLDHELNLNVAVTGYPSDLPRTLPEHLRGRRMYHMEGPVKVMSSTRVGYDIDTWKGQSGSGVWTQRGPDVSDAAVVAVHAYGKGGHDSFNNGTRINQDKYSIVTGWIQAMG